MPKVYGGNHRVSFANTMNYFLQALDYLEPLTFAVGAVVGFRAFRRCRKLGYLVMAVSFCLAVFSLLALPRIKAELRARRTPAPSEETQRKINAAVSEAIERVLREAGTPPAAVEHDLRFPLGPLVLVFGFWLLARREPRIERGSVLVDRRAQEHPAA